MRIGYCLSCDHRHSVLYSQSERLSFLVSSANSPSIQDSCNIVKILKSISFVLSVVTDASFYNFTSHLNLTVYFPFPKSWLGYSITLPWSSRQNSRTTIIGSQDSPSKVCLEETHTCLYAHTHTNTQKNNLINIMFLSPMLNNIFIL